MHSSFWLLADFVFTTFVRTRDISAKAVPRPRQKKQEKGVRAAYGREFCQANMLSYMATAKALLGNHNHSYIGLDGTQVTNKNLDFYLLENLPNGRSAWMIPKALAFR